MGLCTCVWECMQCVYGIVYSRACVYNPIQCQDNMYIIPYNGCYVYGIICSVYGMLCTCCARVHTHRVCSIAYIALKRSRMGFKSILAYTPWIVLAKPYACLKCQNRGIEKGYCAPYTNTGCTCTGCVLCVVSSCAGCRVQGA